MSKTLVYKLTDIMTDGRSDGRISINGRAECTETNGKTRKAFTKRFVKK